MRARACKLAHVHETFGAGLGLRGGGRGRGPDPHPLPAGRLVAARRQAAARVDRRVRRRLGRRPVHPGPRRRRPGQDRGRAAGPRLLPLHDGAARRLRPPRARLRPGRLPGRRGPAARGRARAPVAPRRGRPGRAQSPKVKVVVLGAGLAPPRRGAPDAPEPAPPAEGIHYFLGVCEERAEDPGLARHVRRLLAPRRARRASSSRPWPAGLPVAAADVGTSRDLITHRESGLLVPARNARPWPTPSSRSTSTRTWPPGWRRGGREAVLEKYSAEAMARRIIGVYEFRAHRKGHQARLSL
ncbi:MAG: hypothetical protein MZV63_65180 [Marinilabiliales bacterium]|nr:hypothetical protein [Marinilabiliales bacterium]